MAKEKIDVKKEIIDGINKFKATRFKVIGDYKVDRWLINLAMFICFAYLIFVAYSYNFDLDYYNCPKGTDASISGNKVMLKGFTPERVNGMCKNPFYQERTWKDAEYLPPGEYGTKLGNDFEFAGLFVIIVMLLTIILNHYLNNRNRKNKVRPKLTWDD